MICRNRAFLFCSVAALLGVTGCASALPVKRQEYAASRTERVLEAEWMDVLRAVDSTLRLQRVVKRTPDTEDVLELRRADERTWETGWIESQSRDKYVEYQLDGIPKRKNLGVRLKYRVVAAKALGGVSLKVRQWEELEKLNSRGMSLGYDEVTSVDTSRSGELLEKVQQAILAAPPSADLGR